MAVLSLKLEDEERDNINSLAKEDYRTQQDEIRYLINLGIRERERLHRVTGTQIDMDALKDPSLAERVR